MSHENANEEFDVTGQDASFWRGMSEETFAEIGLPSLVYVRQVSVSDLGEDVRSQIDLPMDAKLYAVHSADGQRMAVLGDRDAAFVGARQYDLQPVSVH